MNSGSLSSKNLSTNEFKSILAENDIEKIVIVNKFFTEGQQRVFPIVDSVHGYAVKGKVAVEVLLATGKGDAEVGGLQGI